MIHLLRTTTRAINDLLDSSTTPHVRIILKRGRLLVQGLFTSFMFKERGMARKCSIYVSKKKKGYGSKGSREMDNFQSMCPKASIKVISEYHGFGACIFGH